MRYQIDYDGSEIQAETQLVSDLDSTLKELFEQFSWKVIKIEKKGAKYMIDLKNPIINKNLNLNVFVGRVRNELRNPRERKIQLSSLDPRIQDENRINIIIGIYCKEKDDALNDLVFIGQPIDQNMNYLGNPSIRGINTEFIQQAKIMGFVRKHTTSVCFFRPEFIYFYIENLSTLSNIEVESITISSEVFSSNIDEPYQKIIYGAPGTGKSHELKKQVEKHFKSENTARVTFHPSYSYQQFVGSYKPSPIYKGIRDTEDKLYAIDKITELADQKEPIIDYTFVPGPFLELLVKAFKSDESFILLIEEINRASVASVFGDVFQLLDRDENGVSEYSVRFNADVSNYLASEGIDTDIRLPRNFYIWATMNSADQGVMPLDSAFKRRWSFEYLPLNEKESVVEERKIIFQGQSYTWNSFRNTLNEELKKLSVPEDKLIGPFFMKKNELEDSKVIKNKLLMYLRDDIVRHKPESLFLKSTFSDIIDDYKNGKPIFRNNLIDNLTSLNESREEADPLEEEF